MKINVRVALSAVFAGFLLGFLDFVWIKFVPFPYADLGNSSAVWAVAAFAFAYLLRAGWLGSVVGAALLLVVAVPSYYLAATLIQNDGLGNTVDTNALLWAAMGLVAALVFGSAGFLARTPGRWQMVALAVPAAVLLAEAALQAARIGDPSYGTEPVGPVLIRVGLAVLFVVLTGRSRRQRALTLLAAVPLAVVGFGLFRLAGFT